MPAPLLSMQNIDLSFGGDALLEGAELAVAAGDKIALVGRNGSGKSTLLKIAAGQVEMDKGERFVQPGATIRYLPQEPDLSAYESTRAYVEAGLTDGDDAYRAQYLLDHLGLTGDEAPKTLSGGEGRRAALARVLAPQPDILLLDEPTNHLDLPAIEWLEGELQSLRSALVIISHDRRFLADLTHASVWLDRGQARRLDQGFAAFEAWRDKLLQEEELERHKLDRQIVREEHWVRYGVTARRKRNVRRMAELSALKQSRTAQRSQTGSVVMNIAEGKSSGTIVLDAKNLSKSYDKKPIVNDFTLRVLRGDRVGIVGPNGAGKTTLINLLTGKLAPDSGTLKLGTNLQLATLDQTRSSLKPSTTLKDALTDGGGDMITINGQSRHVVSYMKDFLFTPDQAGTAIERLSGGERARVTLARALALPSNFLVLDEPTNDLDLETLDLMQEMIADYPGTVIVVSHDRDFLDRVATSIVAALGDGQWANYAGGYSDMLAQRGMTAAADMVGGEAKVTKPAPGKKVSAAAKDKPAPRKKLSYKQQYALQTLPAEIEALAKKIADMQQKLAIADYNKDPGGFTKMTTDLATLEAARETAETAWLELELLREEMEQT